MADETQCAGCVTTISWTGLGASVLLGLFKGTIGILTGSRAITASALYSLNDVFSSVAVIIGLRVATKRADKDHPYGHGNAEYIVCVFTSILILAATAFLIADSFRILFSGKHAPPHWAVFGAAALALLANEVIYRYNICAARRTNSPALLAHAKHHRADAVSSLGVLLAIAAGAAGYHSIDAVVAVLEAGHLLFVSAEILHQGGSGLIDRAIGQSEVSLIREALSAMPDVRDVRDIRTRQIGRSVWIDLYVCLPGDKTIGEVHAISRQIRRRIHEGMEHLENVNVICV